MMYLSKEDHDWPSLVERVLGILRENFPGAPVLKGGPIRHISGIRKTAFMKSSFIIQGDRAKRDSFHWGLVVKSSKPHEIH